MDKQNHLLISDALSLHFFLDPGALHVLLEFHGLDAFLSLHGFHALHDLCDLHALDGFQRSVVRTFHGAGVWFDAGMDRSAGG